MTCETTRFPEVNADHLNKPAQLDLLLPQDLSVEIVLTTTEQIQMRAIVTGIQHALALQDTGERLRQLHGLLATLDDVRSDAAQIDQTGISVKPEQVTDFDRYFNVNRVTSDTPAWPMIRGHLQTCVAVLSLAERSGTLSQTHLTRQIEGFAEYTALLARVFQLAGPA